MLRRILNNGNVKSIAIPVMSFAILGALIMGAVLYGNLVDRADGCRPVGSDSQTGASDDRATLLVYSDEEDALMLCDVPNETVEYDPPQRDPLGVRVGDSWIRLYLENDNEMQDGTFAEIENNDLTKDEIRYSYSYGGTTRRTPVYVKGEFGSVEDCPFFLTKGYESDDFDGFDGSDMFHPDRIQACWIEIDYMFDNGG